VDGDGEPVDCGAAVVCGGPGYGVYEGVYCAVDAAGPGADEAVVGCCVVSECCISGHVCGCPVSVIGYVSCHVGSWGLGTLEGVIVDAVSVSC